MADEADLNPVEKAPVFELAAMRAGRPGLVVATRFGRSVELCFGNSEPRSACAGSVGPQLTHRLRLDVEAARHLEEALTRVLGVQPGAAASRRT